MPQEECSRSQGRRWRGRGCRRECSCGADPLRELGDEEVRDEERRQQQEQGNRRGRLIDVPEDEDQVGEADGGGEAAGTQEAHAKQQKEGREPSNLQAYLKTGRSDQQIGS